MVLEVNVHGHNWIIFNIGKYFIKPGFYFIISRWLLYLLSAVSTQTHGFGKTVIKSIVPK